MPVRIFEIARRHNDDCYRLVAKAKELGFRAKNPSSLLDKITAEALELTVYGKALLIRFDNPRQQIRPSFSGALGRLTQVRSLIAAIKALMPDADKREHVEARVKQLAHKRTRGFY